MLDFGFYNMDCMDGMKEFPDKYFNLAIVDPPYGIGCMTMNYTKSGAIRTHGHSDAKRRDYRKQAEWDIKPDGSYFRELIRVSARQIIWGGKLFFRYVETFEELHHLGQEMHRQHDKRLLRL